MARRASLIALLVLAVALVACGRDDATPTPPAEAEAAGPEPPEAPARTDPEGPALKPAPAVGEGPPPAAAASAPDGPADAAPAGETARVPALSDLMRLPVGSEPKAPDLLASDPPPPDATPEERAAWKERIRVQRRSSDIGPAGPRQGTYSETDAALRVPVSDRVQIEGGVRVNEREEPGREEQERDRGSSSRVGVEVRF